jgi:norsolorinic acid ketoreductase
LKEYLAKPNHIVISANRDPNNAASQALLKYPTAENTKHILVKIDCDAPTDPANAVKDLASQGIEHVDILIANAAIALLWTSVSEVKIEDIQKHMETNVYGFLHLFQAFLPLLKRSKKPTWVTIGSCAAWLTVCKTPRSINFWKESSADHATVSIRNWSEKLVGLALTTPVLLL